jgi:cytoskeletal protein CcmA (bactofilin family)
MFRRKSRTPIEITRLSSLIAAGVEIEGDVYISDGLRIDGRVEGKVLCRDDARGLLVLSENGSIAGGAKVYDAVINGTVHGDIEVEHFLELQPKARVTGNIRYRQLQMECGATVEGKLEKLSDAAGDHATSIGNVVTLSRVPVLATDERDRRSVAPGE